MKVIAVVSAKGGVGKTTVSANLSVALARQGNAVLAVDMDPQNALRFHHFRDQAFHHDKGLAWAHVKEKGIADAVALTPTDNLVLLPYGQCSEQERDQFEQMLRDHPHWLKTQLQALNLPKDAYVVLDTPPGPSAYLQQALRAADYVVIVVLSDAGSYITLPQMHDLIEQYCDPQQGYKGSGIVINQVDRSRALSSDIAVLLRDELYDKVIGRIHIDPAVAEALACGMTVFDYMEQSEAVRDFTLVTQSIRTQLEENEGR